MRRLANILVFAIAFILCASSSDAQQPGKVFAKRFGHRTTAGVPLFREGVTIGTIQLRRARPGEQGCVEPDGGETASMC